MTSTKLKTDAETEHAFVDREIDALRKACAAMEALVMELRAEINQEAIDRERRERELQRLRLEYHRPRPL